MAVLHFFELKYLKKMIILRLYQDIEKCWACLCLQCVLCLLIDGWTSHHWVWRSSSSSNFISRRIHKTYAQHYNSNFTKCIPLAVAREAQRLIGLTTASLTIIQLQGSRVLGGIFHCSQMCRGHYILNMSGSISVSLIFTYSLMI